jgi:DNA polymerase-1
VRKLCTEYRKTEKLLTTYLRVFPKIARPAGNPEWDQPIWTSEQPDGSVRLLAPPPWPEGAKPHHRLYGHFNQTGTVTGRLSSSGPNLQNQPSRGARGKAVRNLFRAPEGHWLVVADYDQLEMRLMAHFSGDPRLVEVFRTGQDPHEMLAHAIFGDVDVETQAPGTACSYRDAAKNLNYAMGYGAGRKKIAQTLCLLGFPTTPEVAGGYLSEMERFYHGLFRWKQRVIAEAKRKGYVKTIGGRRRRLRATFADVANWKLVGYGERQAVNTKVQGSAADILRRAMLRIDREIHELLMIAQVHDELVLETGDARVTRPLWTPLMKLQDIGERGHGFDLRVPLIFTPHVGRTWAEAKVGDDLAELYEEDA